MEEALPDQGRLQGWPVRTIVLAQALIAREIKGQYRRSWLGPVWTLLSPIIYTAVFVFFRSLFNIPTGETPPVLFFFSAISVWIMVAGIVNGVYPAFSGNISIMKKMAVPRSVFLIAATGTPLINFSVSMAATIGLLAYYKVAISWTVLLAPAIVLLAVLLAIGLGMLIVAISLYRTDVLHALPAMLQIWMLLTPIFYPLDIVPQNAQWIIAMNPLVGIVEGYRMIVVLGVLPPGGMMMQSLAITCVVWAIAFPFFRRNSRYVADVL